MGDPLTIGIIGGLGLNAAGIGMSAYEGRKARKDAKRDRKAQAQQDAWANLINRAADTASASSRPIAPLPQQNMGTHLSQLGNLATQAGMGMAGEKVRRQDSQTKRDVAESTIRKNEAYAEYLEKGGSPRGKKSVTNKTLQGILEEKYGVVGFDEDVLYGPRVQ